MAVQRTPPRQLVALLAVLALALCAACQQRPAPEVTARAYLAGWERADYAAMYSYLSAAAQASITADRFAARYQEAADAAALRHLAAALGPRAPDPDDQHARFDMTVRWDTARVGPFAQQLTLPLVWEGERWAVEWQPSLLLAGLGDADRVRYLAEAAPRGAIVDRAGQVLAAPGVERDYPAGTLAAHALGYVERGEPPVPSDPAGAPPEPSPTPPDPSTSPPAPPDAAPGSPGAADAPPAEHGAAGLERWGDAYLTGKPGGRLVIAGPDGAERARVAERPPTPGATLELTLDATLQRRAEALLDGHVGALVALDARDGSVLALASRPTFAPAALSAGDSAPASVLRDRATRGLYPAASVFKVVVMGSALESGESDPAAPFRCTGLWTGLGDGSALEDSVAGGHGILTLTDGFVRSCNTVFYELGKRLNAVDPLLLPRVARAYGFGAPTGLVGLDEAAGTVPDPRTPRDAVELAIGHGGLEVTPLQIAHLFAALATDGTLRTPVLVRQVVAPDGRVLRAQASEAQGALPLSGEHRAAVQAAMRGVVADPRGTAAAAFRGFPVPVAGKTGSAEDGPPPLHAWFAAYAPADAPEIVVVAFVEHGGGGGETAAPLVRGLLDTYFGLR
ncbi:MAG TPA: penicillin-binding transpeptidase domain-containing protein [Chloroflexota bacterium]|nr:penicillin-binding transpeptidase domain-containing protein [Chloroflexota bacterium]